MCLRRVEVGQQSGSHKKSLSVAQNSIDTVVVRTEEEQVRRSGSINKTTIHFHQHSVVPARPVPEEAKAHRKQKSTLPQRKDENARQKPAHTRTKSDCPKQSAPREEAGKTRGPPASKERDVAEASLVVDVRPKTKHGTAVKVQLKDTIPQDGKRRSLLVERKAPVADSSIHPKNAKSDAGHKRSASDGNAMLPADRRAGCKSAVPGSRAGSALHPTKKGAEVAAKAKARMTPTIVAKKIRDKVSPSSYYSVGNQREASAKRSISTGKKPPASHERSISTQIKINTYLQGPADSNSKVISITQDTRIEPSRDCKDSFDVDIVNIAIKRKQSPAVNNVPQKPRPSVESSTRYRQYQNLSKRAPPDEEVLHVGKHYFKQFKMGTAESVPYQSAHTQTSEAKSVAKGYQSTSGGEKKVRSPEPNMTKSTVKSQAPGVARSVTVKGRPGESWATEVVAPLTTGNLARMEWTKDVDELTGRIKKYFSEHNEAPPTTTDFYRIGKLLGKGAFGKVNLGMHKLTGKMVAIKSINKEYLTDESSKRKVMQEYSILKQMRHPSIIRLYETFESSKHILFVIELCCGGDLLTYVRKRRKLKEEVARCVFRRLVDGLHYCHSRRILHRDIKLDNILLNVVGHIKICDFGVSKVVKEGERLTEQCGTPAYIAPEILRDRGYQGFAVDIWSAGVVLYAMLYGTVPFKANNMNELHAMIVKGKYTLKQGISEEARDLLRRMLECDPAKRATIGNIYRHAWMKGAEAEVTIFTDSEIESIRDEYSYAKRGRDNDTRTLFTEQNIDSTQNDLTKNITTKSVILAPFNSTVTEILENEEGKRAAAERDSMMQDKRSMIKFCAKVRDIDRQYEKNNNGEIDNGVYNKLVCESSNDEGKGESLDSSSSHDSLRDDNLEPHNSSAVLNSLASEEENKQVPRLDAIGPEDGGKSLHARMTEQDVATEESEIGMLPGNNCGVDMTIVEKVAGFGYPRAYLLKCLRANELNYATTTYYLLKED